MTEIGALRQTGCCRLPATPSSPWQTSADLLDPPQTRTFLTQSDGSLQAWESTGGRASTAWRNRWSRIATAHSRRRTMFRSRTRCQGWRFGGSTCIYVLVIIDEAGGVRSRIDAVDALAPTSTIALSPSAILMTLPPTSQLSAGRMMSCVVWSATCSRSFSCRASSGRCS